jgi:hypothetical protein
MALMALRVKNAKPGEKLSDGGGLRLDVDKNGNKSWFFALPAQSRRKSDTPAWAPRAT